MAISLKTIATEVGVSREAVSHILNGRAHKVSPATREAVMAAIKQHDYQVNGLVKALRNKRTNTLGVIVPDIQVSLFPEIISSIESAAEAKGYQVLITQSHSRAENMQRQIDLLRQKRVDGLAIFPINSQEQFDLYQKLMTSHVPFVTFLLPLAMLTVPRVGGDERKIGWLAARHLLDLGHTRIVCLRGYPISLDSHQRAEGYCLALQEAGIEKDPTLIAGDNFTVASGYAAVDQLLANNVKFTGLVAATDMVAIGAIQRLWQSGLRIPQDVSVVGCCNLEVGRYFNPPLTTIDQKPAEIGLQCVQMLLDRIENPTADIHEQIIQPELIIRQSTAKRS